MYRFASRLLQLAVTLIVMPGIGCSPSANSSAPIVAEGVIYSLEYQMEGGRTGGLTRVNNSKAVPGGNGAWNIDAYGKLTRDFLIITRPQLRDSGPELIPVSRLVRVQFGDGGIKDVKENQPAAAN